MAKNSSPQQRVNRLVKDLKTTPHQIGLVYLEELLINAVDTNSDISKIFLTNGHLVAFRNKINKHITNNR